MYTSALLYVNSYDKEYNIMQLFSFAFYFKYMLNLQFKVCNDDFLSARLHETQSELKSV